MAFFQFRGYHVWYEAYGPEDSDQPPLLLLHGGPGATHQYLEPLTELAQDGRRVIFYDQIGCGRSDHPTDPAFYSVRMFVDEVNALRAALKLDRVHILGQSWGGMLAMEYALTQPSGLESIIVADSPASIPLWVAEANRLRTALPAEVAETLTKHEAAGTTNSPEYQTAVEVFYRRHVCRLDPWPTCVVQTMQAIAQDGFVYNLLNGPSEFHITGPLKDWDITDRLGEITVPTLLLSGRYDEATPTVVGAIYARIPHCEWILFDESSHMPHIEEPAAFNAAVRGFLAGIDLRTASTV